MHRSTVTKVVLAAVSVFGICIHAFASAAAGNDQSLSLQVATCLDKPNLTIAFIAKNMGLLPVETTPIVTNYNRLVVRRPTGEVVEEFVWKSWPRGFVPVLIAPGETRTWYVNNLAEIIRMKEDGVYGIRWKVGETISEEMLLLKGEIAGEKKAVP
jgi:hypothetical protein